MSLFLCKIEENFSFLNHKLTTNTAALRNSEPLYPLLLLKPINFNAALMIQAVVFFKLIHYNL